MLFCEELENGSFWSYYEDLFSCVDIFWVYGFCVCYGLEFFLIFFGYKLGRMLVKLVIQKIIIFCDLVCEFVLYCDKILEAVELKKERFGFKVLGSLSQDVWFYCFGFSIKEEILRFKRKERFLFFRGQ